MCLSGVDAAITRTATFAPQSGFDYPPRPVPDVLVQVYDCRLSRLKSIRYFCIEPSTGVCFRRRSWTNMQKEFEAFRLFSADSQDSPTHQGRFANIDRCVRRNHFFDVWYCRPWYTIVVKKRCHFVHKTLATAAGDRFRSNRRRRCPQGQNRSGCKARMAHQSSGPPSPWRPHPSQEVSGRSRAVAPVRMGRLEAARGESEACAHQSTATRITPVGAGGGESGETRRLRADGPSK